MVPYTSSRLLFDSSSHHPCSDCESPATRFHFSPLALVLHPAQWFFMLTAVNSRQRPARSTNTMCSKGQPCSDTISKMCHVFPGSCQQHPTSIQMSYRSTVLIFQQAISSAWDSWTKPSPPLKTEQDIYPVSSHPWLIFTGQRSWRCLFLIILLFAN